MFVKGIVVEAVKSHTEATAKDELVVVLLGTQANPRRGPKIVPTRIPLLAGINLQSVEQTIDGAAGRHEVRQVSLRLRRRSVILPAQTKVHGQVRAKLPVILGECTVI